MIETIAKYRTADALMSLQRIWHNPLTGEQERQQLSEMVRQDTQWQLIIKGLDQKKFRVYPDFLEVIVAKQ